MTNNFLAFPKEKGRREVAVAAVNKSTLSIMTSGSILMVGYLLYFHFVHTGDFPGGTSGDAGASPERARRSYPHLISRSNRQERADARKEKAEPSDGERKT